MLGIPVKSDCYKVSRARDVSVYPILSKTIKTMSQRIEVSFASSSDTDLKHTLAKGADQNLSETPDHVETC